MSDFESQFGNCSIYYTLSVMGGKWKWIILYKIHKAKVIRYNKLRDSLQPIAHKTLSNQLKELEASKLIHREQYNTVPPKVEYSLTSKGQTLLPILELMYQWGQEHLEHDI